MQHLLAVTVTDLLSMSSRESSIKLSLIKLSKIVYPRKLYIEMGVIMRNRSRILLLLSHLPNRICLPLVCLNLKISIEVPPASKLRESS